MQILSYYIFVKYNTCIYRVLNNVYHFFTDCSIFALDDENVAFLQSSEYDPRMNGYNNVNLFGEIKYL